MLNYESRIGLLVIDAFSRREALLVILRWGIIGFGYLKELCEHDKYFNEL